MAVWSGFRQIAEWLARHYWRWKDPPVPFIPILSFAEHELTDRDLRGTDLSGAIFTGANLRNTDLRDAILCDADLSGARNLLPHQLGGADLTRAKLPESIAKFEGLAQVAETSKNASTLFAAVLGTSFFVGLTAAAAKDAALFSEVGSTALPLVSLSIPTLGFFWVAPLLLVSLYLYFHLYVLRLWEGMAELPAVFPDGQTLERKVPAWLFNGLITMQLPRLAGRRPPLSGLQQAVSAALGWGLVPVVLFCLAYRYLIRHELLAADPWRVVFNGTTWHSLMLTVAIALPWLMRVRAREALSHTAPLAPEESPSTALDPVRRWASAFYPVLWSLALLPGLLEALYRLSAGPTELRLGRGQRIALPRTHAVLYGADLSQKPPGWTGKDPNELRSVNGVNLSRANLSRADLRRAFLANADLGRANLSGANLQSAVLYRANLQHMKASDATRFVRADLRGALMDQVEAFGLDCTEADLRWASLGRANLKGVKLTDTKLTRANLSEANLSEANLARADLLGADLRLANLKWANLTVANLTGADLTGANLTRAKLTVTDFTRANLMGADLMVARLSGANLTRAKLTVADLTDANLLGADLTRADLTDVNLARADLAEANLTGANLRGTNLKGAHYDQRTTWPHPRFDPVKAGAIEVDQNDKPVKAKVRATRRAR